MSKEFDYIDWITRQQTLSERVRIGIGDDLAALDLAALCGTGPGLAISDLVTSDLAGRELLLVGVDQVLDGVHFDSAVHLPAQIGRKAMNRNLSDCAAMACLPTAAVVTVALPAGVGEEYAKQLYLGMKEAGDLFDCPIVGGDTAAWPGKLVVTVTILGRSAGIQPVTRSGALEGDSIYVSGPLGGSIHGRHMTFEPRVALARELAGKYAIHAMIDLSDGLSRDLGHICRQSKLGALLDGGAIPIHADAPSLSNAINDGEDYELLVVSPDKIEGLARIGVMTREPGIRMTGTGVPLKPAGWEHLF